MAWYQPQELTEALDMMATREPVIVCGGTDVFVNWLRRKQQFQGRDWLDIHRIQSVREIRRVEDGLLIGAAVNAAEIWQSPICNAIPSLQEAARVVGGWQIQNRASIAGNVANASPAADMMVPLFALGARVVLQSVQGERRIRIEDFVLGPKQTSILKHELITHIHIPETGLFAPQTFLRLDQRGGTDISLVSVAVVAKVDRQASHVNIVVGAASPKPFSVPMAEEMVHKDAASDVMKRVAALYAAHAAPITDVRASADYRRAMVGVLVERGLGKVLLAPQTTTG
ncbi:FAD binding domain-containing protein [Alicyclobacillus suci]|uniref:FAD binding domain-containing protein n=1 Tax=Alicyclobacillus suci TaxID=2816080 RepID=UPI001A90094F|nr:FAD binding domain-containing protein [Alicyclobacillus suci]